MLPSMIRIIVFLIAIVVRGLRAACHSRADLVIENLALRQQLTALKQARPKPLLHEVDRAFWVALRGAWERWAELLVIVKPKTVVGGGNRAIRIDFEEGQGGCSSPRPPSGQPSPQ